MFYHFLYPLREFWFGFNVFRYISFRAAFCGITAFLLSILLGPIIIKWLNALNIKERVLRPDAPSLYRYHKHKEGTPTMGGIIIIASLAIATLLWADLSNSFIRLVLLGTVWLGVIGFIDDYIKTRKRSKGIGAIAKLSGQLLLGFTIGVILYLSQDFRNSINFPFFKDLILDLGILYILFVVVVIVGSSNAVNITDGLDGLAIGCVVIIAITYGILSYITGHAKISEYLNIFYHPQAGELAVFCAGILGSGLGFLWFNSHPAEIFMGDTGSLALGGAIGMVAVFIKKELLLFLVGGIFVLETFSVLLQVAVFKWKGRRPFLMAPIHHHFQLKGWNENKIIVRFWIVAIILSLFALATLKLR